VVVLPLHTIDASDFAVPDGKNNAAAAGARVSGDIWVVVLYASDRWHRGQYDSQVRRRFGVTRGVSGHFGGQ